MSGQPTDETRLPPRRRGPRAGLDGPTNLGPSPQQGHKPGDIIGTHYKVVRQIGAGGMGVVYEVINTITGVPSAVKRLSPELSISAEHREAFIREATDTMQFTGKSEYFVTTQTVDIDTNGPFLVLEYVEHPTLRSIIEQHPEGLPVDAATNILHGLAYSLVELHRLGFVHRDLKPENVFVGPPADEPLVMLADFGLSKSHTERTRTSIRRAGTDRYISPEQRNGLETNITTDIYAFGIMAIELLTGDVLSPGDSLEDEKPDLPADLCTLVNRCTKRRQEQRPATSDELFEVLDTIRNQLLGPKFRPGVIHFVTKQPGVLIDCDGQQSSAESPLVIPFETSDERRIRVDAKWRNVSLLISFINLSPGDEHTIELPAGFVFDAELPSGCTLFYKNGSAVSLPLTGQIPQQGYCYFEVFHDGASVLSQKVTIHPGENYWRPSIVLPAKPELRRTTLRFTNLQTDAVVKVDGTTVEHKAGWSAMVAAERIRRVHIEVDWRGVILYSSTLPLNSGDQKLIDVPHVYQLNVVLPAGVTARAADGHNLTFPMKAELPSSRSKQVELYYRNQSLGKHTVKLSAGVNTWTPTVTLPSEPQKLISKVSLYEVMVGAEVWINGSPKSKSFVEVIEIPTGEKRDVSIKCVWRGVTLYDSRVSVAAGESKTVQIPRAYELTVVGLPVGTSLETSIGSKVSSPIRGLIDSQLLVPLLLRFPDGNSHRVTVPITPGNCTWHPSFHKSSLVLEGLQHEALIKFDQQSAKVASRYEMEILEGTSQSVHVSCTWRDVPLMDKTFTVRAGEIRKIDVPQGYQLDVMIPKGYVAKLKGGTVQSFPMKGLVPSNSTLSFELIYGAKVVKSIDVGVRSGWNSWSPDVSVPLRDVAPLLSEYVDKMCLIPASCISLSETYVADLEAFSIGNTTVTVKMWQEYIVANGLKMPPTPEYGWFSNNPMTNVSWNDCRAYARWACKVSGINLYLPTEAQWHAAACSGNSELQYPWGHIWLAKYALHATDKPGRVDRDESIYVSTYGVSDMASNVSEWCSDWMLPYPEGIPLSGTLNELLNRRDPVVKSNPVGPTSGEHKVIRGGSYCEDKSKYFTTNYRRRSEPTNRLKDVGFRLTKK